ncbi:MAG: hypothetical protein L0G99_07475 [Propionibacteriales bacterium]|nr:hypothetical protein [Propionibacteriales bacterium]
MISLVVPLKDLSSAKSRFVDAAPELRRRLAWSMFCDTVLTCAEVADLVVVVSDVPGVAASLRQRGVRAVVVPDPGGLNSAFTAGASVTPVGGMVGCVMGDLPALTRAELVEIAVGASTHPRAFLADADGVGTTMLFSSAGLVDSGGSLDPRFDDACTRHGSAMRHLDSGAVALSRRQDQPGWPGARRDVDDPSSLIEAARIGLGRHTRPLTDGRGRLGVLAELTVAEHRPDHELIMVTIDGRLFRTSTTTAAGLHLRPGQRCHAALDADHRRVLSIWL